MKKPRHRALTKARWEIEVHENMTFWTAMFESIERHRSQGRRCCAKCR